MSTTHNKGLGWINMFFDFTRGLLNMVLTKIDEFKVHCEIKFCE